MKAIAVRRQPAHGMKRHWPRLRAEVLLAPGVCPGDGQLESLFECGVTHFNGQLADAVSTYAGDGFGPLGCARGHAVAQQLKRWCDAGAIGQHVVAFQRWVATLGDALGVSVQNLPAGLVPHQLVVRVAAVARWPLFRIRVKRKQAFACTLVQHYQLRRIGKALEKRMVKVVGSNQFMQQRHEQRAIGAGADGNPFVRNGRITCAHRVDRDELAPCPLEFADGNLHRVAVVVLRRADHHKQLGVIQVWPAKFPKAATNGVNHARRHVDRAKPAMRGVIGCTELARKQARQGLHLVAPGEQGKLLRISRADFAQALGQYLKGALPTDGLKFGRAALSTLFTQQWLGESRRRILLHDARAALGADHTLVQWVRRVAIDVAHLGAVVSFAQMHTDATAAGAHVAGGALNLSFGRRGRRGNRVVKWLFRQELVHLVPRYLLMPQML